jgi:PKD repeat protein
VKFNDSSTGAGAGTTYSWDFGDGATSTAKDPTHVYATPGIFTVSHTATNACGSDTDTKAAYITVADGCPDPVYTVTNASWSNVTDGDNDGYATRARLTWGTNLAALCTRSVFARIYSRPVGETSWTLVVSTACYTVPGRTTNFSQFIQGLSLGCYEFRIDVLECGGTEVKASRGPGDDADLTNRCFEP